MMTNIRPKAAAPPLRAAAKHRTSGSGPTGKNHKKEKVTGSNGQRGEPPCLLLELVREAKAEVTKCGAQLAIPRLDELEATLRSSLPAANPGCGCGLPSVASPQEAASASPRPQLENGAGYDPKKTAQVLGLTANKLSRHCQERNGCSCEKLLRNAELQAAAEMLREGRPVKEVAIALHYRNPANFCRSFKRVFNMSPWQYVHGTSYHQGGRKALS